jgi:PhzF family phenazine biosynthesis protein
VASVACASIGDVSVQVLRYAAFPAGDTGGNPADVVLDARGMTDSQMLAVAAQVGFSETAFLSPAGTAQDDASDGARARVRYFSPLAEVPFCGHATIATAVAHAERHGPGRLHLLTPAGLVPVQTRDDGGRLVATLTSVVPSIEPLSIDVLAAALDALGWPPDVLDAALPPYVAYAGNHHPVLAVRSRQTLAALDYDYTALAALMDEQTWTTVQIVHRERADLFHARDPFPPGGVVEDPATGSAAAALGGYLRTLGIVPRSRHVVIRQGEDMGRPSELLVDIPEHGGIDVTGAAIPL